MRCDSEGFGLETVSGGSRNHLAGSHVKLAGTISKRRAVVIHITNQRATAIALDLGPLPLDSPVIKGLKERSDLVLLLESELGGVDYGKGGRALVSGLKVEIGGK